MLKLQEMVAAVYEGVISKLCQCRALARPKPKLTKNLSIGEYRPGHELKVITTPWILMWMLLTARRPSRLGSCHLSGAWLGVLQLSRLLTYKAREYEVPTRFIELANEINTATLVVGKQRRRSA